MTITLISKKEYKELLKIQENNAKLTLQNKGYETPKKEEFSEEDKKAHARVTEILKGSIKDFVSFTNFRLSLTDRIEIRFQYKYEGDLYFVGVGYLFADELLNGFDKEIVR